MAKFLVAQELYRLFQRELPPGGVYPDGQPSDFFSTASIYSKAQVLETVYANLRRIYLNQFPQSADERIDDWEIKVFGAVLNSADDLATRQEKLLIKIRAKPTLSMPSMMAVVASVLGAGVLFDIISWASADGAWRLGESQLGVSTFLAGARLGDAASPTLCNASPSDFGKTSDEWTIMQATAYTYEVRIYGTTISAQARADLDYALRINEPARSQHIITDGLNPNNQIDGGDYGGVPGQVGQGP